MNILPVLIETGRVHYNPQVGYHNTTTIIFDCNYDSYYKFYHDYYYCKYFNIIVFIILTANLYDY